MLENSDLARFNLEKITCLVRTSGKLNGVPPLARTAHAVLCFVFRQLRGLGSANGDVPELDCEEARDVARGPVGTEHLKLTISQEV